MIRRLLHVLLALTLALNGISAPWAMARMSHDRHAGHGASHGPDAPTESSPAAHAHHGVHSGHGHPADPGVAQVVDPTPPASSGSCCDGAICHCGCVLPPALLLMALAVPAAVPTVTPFVFPPQHAVLRRGSPPFRPPAV
jgi:hypothetical protein